MSLRFKSIKSIKRITLTNTEPVNWWKKINPAEYVLVHLPYGPAQAFCILLCYSVTSSLTCCNRFPPHLRYGFWANVNPDVRHPRWSQAQETFYVDGGSNARRIPTVLYNGYGEEVSYLYGTSREYFYR